MNDFIKLCEQKNISIEWGWFGTEIMINAKHYEELKDNYSFTQIGTKIFPVIN